MIAFGKQIQVHFAEQRAIAVRVFGDLLAACPIDFQLVGLSVFKMTDEETRDVAHLKLTQFAPVIRREQTHTQGAWQVGADELPAATIAMWAENRKRVTMFSTDQRIHVHCGGHRLATHTGFVRCIHVGSPSDRCSNPRKPCSGTASQVGRFSAS